MSTEFPKAGVDPAETKEKKIARLRAELAALEKPEAPAAPEVQAAAPAEAVQEETVETAATSNPAVAERTAADAVELAITRERLGMPSSGKHAWDSPPDSERVRLLGEQLESLKTTNSKSAERLRSIRDEVRRNPELFEGDSGRSEEFMDRIVKKAEALKSGPELMEKKRKFWEKWKIGSVLAGGGAVLGTIGGAAWTATYGFDHTMMLDVLGHSLNGPMVAGAVSGLLSTGSMGIAKLMEILRGDKGYKLEENLKRYNI